MYEFAEVSEDVRHGGDEFEIALPNGEAFDSGALEQVLPLIYQRLRHMASRYMKGERAGHTLQTTALINETYLELAKNRTWVFKSREQFFFFAGQMMRRILVRYARERLALKRGNGQTPVSLDTFFDLHDGYRVNFTDLVALDQALERLATMDLNQSRIVQLRFFAGMSEKETAEMLGMPLRSVQREWHTAKLWLARELEGP